MADYRELLRRAVNALPENNGTARRAVYEKARSALVTQLHAIEPKLSSRDITQHRLTLEDCIRQVEQEATEKLLQGLSHREDVQTAAAAAAAIPVVEPVVEEELEPEHEELAPPPEPVDDEPVEAEVVEAEADPAEDFTSVQDAQIEIEPSGDDSVDLSAEDDATDFPDPEEIIADDAYEAVPARDESDAVDEADDDGVDDSFDQTPVGDDLDHMHKDQADPVAPEVIELEDDSDVGDDVDLTDDGAPDGAFSENDLADQLSVLNDEPRKFSAASVDDVIAQARAASGAPAPVIDDISAQNAEIGAALSAVREVEMLSTDVNANDDGDDDAQATIDRAILALDREAQGKGDGELLEESSKGAIAAATDEAGTDHDNTAEFVEDEETGGGNGLFVFLGVFVLLAGLFGGGTYWASREGFVDLNPILNQLGFATSQTGTVVATNDAATEATTTDTAQTPPETNVRDVTPGTGEPVVDVTPDTTTAETETPNTTTQEPATDERLTPEDATGDDTTTTTTTADNSAQVPTDEVNPDAGTITSPETADATDTNGEGDDARLPSEDAETPGDIATENPLNVQDPNATETPGAQSLLIEEQTSGSGGAVPFSGQTEWSRDVDELGVPIIRGTASIPARNLSVDVLIRKNADEALPASHLMEVNFTVTDSFLGGAISSLPGVLLKNQELAQGTALVGASVRIVDNSFLFAMSETEVDLARNLELLGQNGWLDLPVIYSTGRKAILTLEKGAAGTEIFEDVLTKWAE